MPDQLTPISSGAEGRSHHEWLQQVLNVLYNEQQEQTRYLKRISSVATFVAVLIIIALILQACGWLMS